MSNLKIKAPCEFNGVEYKGVVATDGVNIDVSPGCAPLLGNVVSFSKGQSVEDGGTGKEAIPSPILFVSALQSISIGDDIPTTFLVLTVGEDE